VHDAFSCVGVTLPLLRLMVFGREWSWHGCTGSPAEYALASSRRMSRRAWCLIASEAWRQDAHAASSAAVLVANGAPAALEAPNLPVGGR